MAIVWRTALVVAVLLMLVYVLAKPALAHSWYEPFPCCSGFDCKPVPNGTVIGGPSGWSVKPPGATRTTLVPYGDARVRAILPAAPIEDRGVFHVCTRGGEPDGDVLCVYVPDGGS